MKTGIALLLGTGLLTTIRADGAGPPEVVAPPQPVLRVATDALPKTPKADVWVLATSIAPGAATLWHTHPTPPVVYVESGTATWEYEGGRSAETRHMGQAIMEPANVAMRIANHGTTSVRIVIFQVTKPGQQRIQPAP